jgi:hypothetical protein
MTAAIAPRTPAPLSASSAPAAPGPTGGSSLVRTGLIAGAGLALGATLGGLIGARSGHAVRGAALGATLIGGIAALAGCSSVLPPRGREVGTIDTTITEQQPIGSHRVTGTRTDTDGNKVEVDETVTDYRNVKRDVVSHLDTHDEVSYASLDAFLGAVDLPARANSDSVVVLRREGDHVLAGRGQAVPNGATNPASIKLADPSVIATVGFDMYLESSGWKDLEHPVTYGAAATAADRAAIEHELG